jgi:2-keto-4-pentenoate hydratase
MTEGGTKVTVDGLTNYVDELHAARREGRTGLDLTTAGLSRDAGLGLQLAVADRFVSGGDEIAGWKVSYTSGKARDKMGLGYRPFGYILRSRTLSSGGSAPFADFANAQIEGELGVRIGTTLRGEVTPEQARDATAEIVACFELNESRCSRDSDDATTLADGCGQWGLVCGSGTTTIGTNLEHTTAVLQQDGAEAARSDPDLVMDDLFLSVSRLAAMLERFDRPLEAGAVVITGSIVKAPVTGPSSWRAEFDGVGRVEFAYT